MKDSQQDMKGDTKSFKYIKANNERFSTSPGSVTTSI